ncbi:MAG: hypothetical protein RIQ72_162 [Candidatus Parcubacteria bacterium]|jgi:hypothetical protein
MPDYILPRTITLSELKDVLTQAGINLSTWGVGEAKTVEHFLEEVQSGESKITIKSDGSILKELTASIAFVYYNSPDGKKFILREHKQVFKDGRERIRNIPSSISEKNMPGEEPEEAIIRGIKEELGIEALNIQKIGKPELSTQISTTFPGLIPQITLHTFETTLTDSQYNPEGYIEHQEDKDTYFIWQEVEG